MGKSVKRSLACKSQRSFAFAFNGFATQVSSPSYITQSSIISLRVPEQYQMILVLEKAQPSCDIRNAAEHLVIKNLGDPSQLHGRPRPAAISRIPPATALDDPWRRGLVAVEQAVTYSIHVRNADTGCKKRMRQGLLGRTSARILRLVGV